MGLGNDQGVAVVHRGDIQKSQYLGGFQDSGGGQLAGGDAAKDAVWHRIL